MNVGTGQLTTTGELLRERSGADGIQLGRPQPPGSEIIDMGSPAGEIGTYIHILSSAVTSLA